MESLQRCSQSFAITPPFAFTPRGPGRLSGGPRGNARGAIGCGGGYTPSVRGW
ncbi:hypothetical protein HMPREF0731_2156 [Pseudoroseomonas cervicalis ATCC 49957]|uniref:Uncharacterized protein n=1 Tax=Pseudoroseomonas cervicalis ATCC 49957 TaxID=525371 RepID=D5RM45_9PROT|nr:hypothetical protein HMPREF0731_2156 [Pseudoroseomonas cervicalis ATCC 49957]